MPFCFDPAKTIITTIVIMITLENLVHYKL